MILLIAMALYTFQRDENQYLYLYTTFKFNWNVDVYSTFKTFKSTAYVVAMLVAVPLMNKVFHWKDTVCAPVMIKLLKNLSFYSIFLADHHLHRCLGACDCSCLLLLRTNWHIFLCGRPHLQFGSHSGSNDSCDDLENCAPIRAWQGIRSARCLR